uniref:Platelet-activating factor receptor n=1 Tax=Oryzias latipes TaxID=8090 RepID=A0A3P9I6Q9_ORYLA
MRSFFLRLFQSFWTRLGTTNKDVTAASTANSSEFLDSNFRYMLFSIVYSIIFVVGFLANVFVLYVLQCLRDAKGMGEIGIYMTNLTIADLLFVCALPFLIGYYSRGGHWIYEEFLCRLTGSFFFINTYGSIVFLGAISLNRYWAVTQPLNAAAWNHRRRGIIVSVLIWLCTVSLAIPSLPSEGTQTDKDNLTRLTQPGSSLKWLQSELLLPLVSVFSLSEEAEETQHSVSARTNICPLDSLRQNKRLTAGKN